MLQLHFARSVLNLPMPTCHEINEFPHQLASCSSKNGNHGILIIVVGVISKTETNLSKKNIALRKSCFII